jgi:hypothetical protein
MKPREPFHICVYNVGLDGCPLCIAEREAGPAFQKYWRCAHYPSAMTNFFSTRQTCEWDCHTTELQWHHSGFNPMPKSWGTPAQVADKIFGV